MRAILLTACFLSLLACSAFSYIIPYGTGVTEERGLPFLLHDGMPYPPGQMNIRFSTFHANLDDTASDGSGAHVEVGLWKDAALHIRNDHIQRGVTEIMLQVAMLWSEDRREGISFTIENDTSTPSDEPNSVFVTGFTATKYFFGDPFNCSLHFDLKNSGVEVETSYVKYLTDEIDLIFECFSSSISNPTFFNTSYTLEGIRFHLSPSFSVAIATQSPISHDRMFDTLTQLQTSLTL